MNIQTNVYTEKLYTQWPISIYNPKYLLNYFIYEKMFRTKVDQDRGGHLTVPSILTLRSIFKVKWSQDPFIKWEPLFLTADLKRAGNFTSKMTCGKMAFVTCNGKKLRSNVLFLNFLGFGVNKHSRRLQKSMKY